MSSSSSSFPSRTPLRVLLLATMLLLVAASAQAQPTFSKEFFPDDIGPGSVSLLTFTIDNPNGVPADELAFTDNLPAGLSIANSSAATDCGPGVMLSAPEGGTTISMTDGRLPPGGSCTVTVYVVSSAMPTSGSPVTHMNVSGMLTSTIGSAGPATDDLTVTADLPGFTKSFSPSTISPGQTSTVTLTIDNTANPSGVGILRVTDDLPPGMLIASPAAASTDCGNPLLPPTVTAVSGTSTFSLLANGLLPPLPALAAGASCTITFNVTVSQAGSYVNTTQDLLLGVTEVGKATAELDVPLDFLTKSFLDDPVAPGGMVTLEFMVTNLDRNSSATNIAFTDDLSATLTGLTFANLLYDDCNGMIAGMGTGLISYTGGTLPPEASCTVRVELSVPPGAVTGSYLNTTGAITADLGGSPIVGNMATDFLAVEPIPSITKEYLDDPVNPGESVELEFTITNTSAVSSATDIEFIDVFDTVIRTASVTPPSECCGPGSSCTYTAHFNPSPPCNPCDGIPARLTVTGANLAPAGMAGDSCTFSLTLDVAADAQPGLYPNTTGEVTATVEGATRVVAGATDDLEVIAAPRLTKVFVDSPVAPGGTSTLEFSLELSPNSPTAATSISFTDDLEAALTGLTALLPPSPDPPCGAGSTLTGSAGDTFLTFAGGSLMPGDICTFSVQVFVPLATVSDIYTNTTSDVTATVSGVPATSAAASADLNVASLQVSKEFLGDPALPGDDLTLRFTIAKADPAYDVTGISFVDSLSSALSGLAAVAPLPVNPCGAGSTLSGTTTLTFDSGNIPPGTPSCTFDVTVHVPGGSADGTYINVTTNPTATVDGSGPLSFDPATDDLVVDTRRLSIIKEFTDDPVAPGDLVTLEFMLANLDPAQAVTAVAFTDNLASALTGMTFDNVVADTCMGVVNGIGTSMVDVSGVTLAAGASCIFRIQALVPIDAVAGVYGNTSSDITGMIGGVTVEGGAASDELEVVELLLFGKSFDGPTTATGTATITFSIANPNPAAASNLQFSDDLNAVIPGLMATSLPTEPCGVGSTITGTTLLTFSGGEVDAMGGNCSFDVEVLVPVTATPGSHPNVTSDLSRNGLTVAPPATADLVIEPPPDFAKVFSPDVIFADGVSTLTFTIDNSASALGADDLAFVDNFPAGVVIANPPATASSCGGTLTAIAGSGSIALVDGSVGAGATCTIDVNVTSLVSAAHVNTTGDLTSTSGNSGTASDTLTVTPTADLSVTKTDGVTTATPGDSVTYTIVVANAGPSADPAASLTDAFPSPPLGCSYTSVASGGATGNTNGMGDLSETLSMPVGSSVTYTAICAIDSDATGTLSNTVTVTPSVNDMVPGNNSATDDDTVLVPSADLAITKTDGVTSAVPGQTTLTYTIVASNAGLSDDPSVSVTDSFPAPLTCTFTSVAAGGATGNTVAGAGDLSETLSMPAGSSVTYTAICTIDPAATGTLSNTATISGSVDDPNAGNNSATDNDTVLTPQADLSVTKTDGVTSAVPGQDTLTYTIVVANAGPSVDPAASLADVFPASLTCSYISIAAGGATGNTAAGAGDLAETLSLPEASSVTYTASCAIDPAATGTLSNTATVTASVTDPAPGNNSATDGDTVLTPEADLSIVKSTDVTTVTVGDTIDYDLEVTNDGPSAATGIVLDDPTPTGLVFETADAPCAGGFPCALDDLGPGSSVTITATYRVPSDYAGPAQITNTATVSADTTDNNGGNDSDTVMTDVEFDADPPSVTAITTVNGPLAACDDLRQPVSGISVTIEDTTSPIVGADVPANYLLVGSGPDGDFTTASCAGGAAGDDEAVMIASVAVDDTDPLAVTATPSVAGPEGLPAGLYRFFVCGTIEDAAGNALDGGDFEVSFFRANPGNLFENGNFDDCPSTLDPWTPTATPPNALQTGLAGADDFAGSPLSASAHIVQTDPASSSLEQCVAVDAEAFYDLEAWLRYDAPLGALAVYEQVCEFFDAAGCGGASLGQASLASLLEDVGPVWSFSEVTFGTPAGAASALCRFETGPLGADPVFNLYLDGLFLGGTNDPEIFSDGFESGDTAAWSTTVP